MTKTAVSLQLSNEALIREFIEERLASEFALAAEILGVGKEILNPGSTITDLPETVVITGMGLLAKACKQYRAVCEMVAMGLGEPADSLTRMMFETVLAACFLNRKQVVIKREGQRLPKVAGKPLTRGFRSILNVANHRFTTYKIVNNMMKTPRLRRKISAHDRKRSRQDPPGRRTRRGLPGRGPLRRPPLRHAIAHLVARFNAEGTAALTARHGGGRSPSMIRPSCDGSSSRSSEPLPPRPTVPPPGR